MFEASAPRIRRSNVCPQLRARLNRLRLGGSAAACTARLCPTSPRRHFTCAMRAPTWHPLWQAQRAAIRAPMLLPMPPQMRAPKRAPSKKRAPFRAPPHGRAAAGGEGPASRSTLSQRLGTHARNITSALAFPNNPPRAPISKTWRSNNEASS